MVSKTKSREPTNIPAGSIAEHAAEATRAAAQRARGMASEVLRAREIPEFSLGSERTDVRGWQVYSNDAELVGAVSSILIDMRTKMVRYLGIALRDSRTRIPNGEVLVPVGSVSRPDDRQVLVVNALSRAQLLAAPRVSNRPVTRADEHATLIACGMQPDTSAGAHDLYGTPFFDERRLFGDRGSRSALA
jgi:sporulation protein YlmC with PRC-barrel domain